MNSGPLRRLWQAVLGTWRSFNRSQWVEPACEARAKEIVASINEIAHQTNTLTLAFLPLVLYLAITAVSTSDERLLVNERLSLPLLNVAVPLQSFFWVAPLIILFLHLNLLLLEYLVKRRLCLLPPTAVENSGEAESFYFIPSVSMRLGWKHHQAVRWLQYLAFFAVDLALPLLTLLLLQVKFLPYHGYGTTLLHQLTVTIDLGLAWFFLAIRPRTRFRPPHSRWWRLGLAFCGLISLAILRFAWSWATVPATCQTATEDRFLHRNLSLVGHMLPSGLDLHGRDLRCASFRSADLTKADFRGADLREVDLSHATLVGARFAPESVDAPVEGEPEPVVTPRGADLDRASLVGANLSDADFYRASLRQARLNGANLRRAHFVEAWLDRAVLDKATLSSAQMGSASLKGASLRGICAEGIDLSSAQLEVASLGEAWLDGAKFYNATLDGASFGQASLRGAAGLSLRYIDLRKAHVKGVDFCEQENRDRLPKLADLRGIDATTEEKCPCCEAAHSAEHTTCLVSEVALNKATQSEVFCNWQLLNTSLAGWPPCPILESTFQAGSAGHVVALACEEKDDELAVAISQRVIERLLVDLNDLWASAAATALVEELRTPSCGAWKTDRSLENLRKIASLAAGRSFG